MSKTIITGASDRIGGAAARQHARIDRRWWALALLALAEFVVVLDASIVNIALPTIQRGLRFSPTNLSWVVNAYVLTFGGFLLLGGRVADLLGRRRVFVVGLAVFSAASLAGGLAQSEAWLIGARAVQGIGAAVLAPSALSIVTATFREGAEPNRALSIWGAVAGSGAAAGVLLGGVLTSALGWRSVLFVNVPIGIGAIVLAPRLISESRAELALRSFDISGAVTVTAGLSALVYSLVRAPVVGWGSACRGRVPPSPRRCAALRSQVAPPAVHLARSPPGPTRCAARLLEPPVQLRSSCLLQSGHLDRAKPFVVLPEAEGPSSRGSFRFSVVDDSADFAVKMLAWSAELEIAKNGKKLVPSVPSPSRSPRKNPQATGACRLSNEVSVVRISSSQLEEDVQSSVAA
jgi:hypothetical protein